MGDSTGPGGTPADYAINALAVWVQLQGEAIHSDDLTHATRLGRKLRRGRSVWTVTFIITGGLILLGGCSKGLGLFASPRRSGSCRPRRAGDRCGRCRLVVHWREATAGARGLTLTGKDRPATA